MSAIATKGLSLSIPASELLPAVKACADGAAQGSVIAILRGIKVEADKDGLTLTSCDAEGWVQRKVHAMVTEPGEAVINAKDLLNAAASLSGQIDLEQQGGLVIAKNGISTVRLPFLDAEDFPVIPNFEALWSLEITAKDLRYLHHGTRNATDSEKARMVLMGPRVRADGETLTFTATNTHHILKHSIPFQSKPLEFIPRLKDLDAILELGFSDSELILIEGNERQLRCERSGDLIVTQTIMGTYPNLERTIPTDTPSEWVVEKAELERAIKFVLPFAAAKRCLFKQEEGQIRISSRDADGRDCESVIPAVCSGPPVDLVAFAGNYVLNIVGSCPSEHLRFGMTAPSRPAKFASVDDSPWIGVIMPMSVN